MSFLTFVMMHSPLLLLQVVDQQARRILSVGKNPSAVRMPLSPIDGAEVFGSVVVRMDKDRYQSCGEPGPDAPLIVAAVVRPFLYL